MHYSVTVKLGSELKSDLKRPNQKERIAKAIHSYNSKIADAMVELKLLLGSKQIKMDNSLPDHWKEFIKFYNHGNYQHFVDLYAALYSKSDVRTDLRMRAIAYPQEKKLKAFKTAVALQRPVSKFTNDLDGIRETIYCCFASRASKDRYRQNKEAADDVFHSKNKPTTSSKNSMTSPSKQKAITSSTSSASKKRKSSNRWSTSPSKKQKSEKLELLTLPKADKADTRDDSYTVGSITKRSSVQLGIMEESPDSSVGLKHYALTDRESTGSTSSSSLLSNIQSPAFDGRDNPCMKEVCDLISGESKHIWVYDEEAPLVKKVQKLLSEHTEPFLSKKNFIMKRVNLKSFLDDDILATNGVSGLSKANAALQLQITYTDDYLELYGKLSEVLSGRKCVSEEDITTVTAFLKENYNFRYYRQYHRESYNNTHPSGHCGYLALHQMHIKTALDKVDGPLSVTDTILKNWCIKSPGNEEDRKNLVEFLDSLEGVLIKTTYKGGLFKKMLACRNQLKNMNNGIFDMVSWPSNNELCAVPTDFAVVNLLQVTNKENPEYIPKPPELINSDQREWAILYMTNLIEKKNSSDNAIKTSCMSYSELRIILGSSKLVVFNHSNEGGHFYGISTSNPDEEISALDQLIDGIARKLLQKLATSRCVDTEQTLAKRKSCLVDEGDNEKLLEVEDSSEFDFRELFLVQEKTIKRCLKRIQELESEKQTNK